MRLKIFEGKCVEKCVRYWRAYVGERERERERESMFERGLR